MARQRSRFMGDSFLKVPIRSNDPGAVIHQGGAKPRCHHAFRHRHADRGGDPLAERAGGGFNPGMLAEFRMARGGGMQLAEAPQLIRPHAFMAGQVQ